MNILYIIGNGFDIAQGCDTSYAAFYDYLKQNHNDDPDIKELLVHIESDQNKNWSDMERALGEYTAEFEDESKFRELYFKIKDALQVFLTEIDQSFVTIDAIRDKYHRDLVRPDTYLNKLEQQTFDNYFNSFHLEGKNLSIATFNYTQILEKALGNIVEMKTLPTAHNVYRFNEYCKIHGSINDEMLMGVDSIEQVKNAKFRDNEDFTDYFVKPKENRELGELVDDAMAKQISASNLIVTMGTSFGITDNTWWKRIGTELRNRTNLYVIINAYDNSAESARRALLPGIKRKKKYDFLKQCGIKENEYELFRNRVFVSLNEGFLQPKLYAGKDERVGR